MGPNLTASARYTSPLPPKALIDSLKGTVERTDGGFEFVSKLSGGGVVVRALRAPESQLPWFGTVEGEGFSIAKAQRDRTASPFQPILRGTVRAEGQGSILDVELAPHPGVRSFSILYIIGGVLLAFASVLALGQSPIVGGTGLAFAALFLFFPNLRAKIGFDHGCRQSLEAFEDQLGLRRHPGDWNSAA